MSDFKSRLKDEFDQLKEKTEKLETFLDSENSSKIDRTQLILLHAQLGVMKSYGIILNERLNLLG